MLDAGLSFKDQQKEPDIAKNITVFSDGTCNESDKGYPTNVYKLYQAIERRTDNQVAFYDPGVGTNIYDVTGAAFGTGISKNIRECYEFIVDAYQPGDKIFLFGFSRGAYTIRSLGGMLSKSGLLKKYYRAMVEKAFDIYKDKDNDDQAEVFKQKYCWQKTENKGNTVAVYCIGVWDTVSALGLPFATAKSLNPFSRRWSGFHNTTLAPEVRYGFQAISIDDNRKIFKPEIWDEASSKEQTIEQVWFPGVHSNVGGGYRRTELSDICLEWMIEKAKSIGLLFWPKYTHRVLMRASPHGKIYDPRSGFGRIYVPTVRVLPKQALVHQSAFNRRDRAENRYDAPNIPKTSIPVNNDGPV